MNKYNVVMFTWWMFLASMVILAFSGCNADAASTELNSTNWVNTSGTMIPHGDGYLRAPPNVTTGLVSYWNPETDIGSGNTLTDIWGVNDGTIHGATWNMTSGMMEYNGTSDYVDCGNDESTDFSTGPYTLYAEVYPTTELVRTTDEDQNFIGRGYGEAGVAYPGYKLAFDKWQGLEFLSGNGSLFDVAYENQNFDKNVHYVTGVRNDGRIKLYINDILASNISDSGYNTSTVHDFLMGVAYTYQYTKYFNGSIGKVYVYNVFHTNDQVNETNAGYHTTTSYMETDSPIDASSGYVNMYVWFNGTDAGINTTIELQVKQNDTATWETAIADVTMNTNLTIPIEYLYQNASYKWFANTTHQPETDIIKSVTFITAIQPLVISIEQSAPSPINTNYTGTVTQSYLITHGYPLNLSSLAYLYGVNYTPTSDMYSYISAPYNTISSEGLYRAPNRNKTPYLSWEYNTTITEDNVWQWGGGDNNSFWITKNQIDSTHTYVNLTGVTHHIFPSSNYIAKLPLYQSPKTQYDISKAQGIIIQIWDIEQFRNRNNDYLINLYFDSDIKSTYPTEDIELYFLPGTFDPLTGDPEAEGILLDTWNSTRWMTHSWIPHTNASYTDALTIAADTITPANTYYAYLKSNTPSSKAYTINATNIDPGITNITFAQTNSMWLRNEIADTTDAVAYTPSFFTTFTRDFLEFDTQLYIADTNGTWAHSGINTTTIGLSEVPVSAVSFEYFNKSCSIGGYIHDVGMDGTYDDGAIQVSLNCPADPDGGSVDHNLTLHYANRTFIAVINDTFNTTGLEQLEINFTTSTYYSLTNLYTMKCVSEDEENNIVTRWIDVNFTLAADGTQGWVDNTRILFWGMNNIPTLYTTVNDSSLISYHAGTNIYTMHVPFFKSKSNDTFYFNETVHLESLNNEGVAYFRTLGDTKFDYAYIYGWNTVLDTAAPSTDTYRSYVYSCCESIGNITNSEMSYLGTNEYQREGLNFISNTRDYLIFNSTFSHNAEGPIFEYSENMNISNNTITNSGNVGLGIYYSNNSVISGNTISPNGGRGISIYEGNNHIVEDNTILNSGVHGIHIWSNSENNTCTANTITGSTLYDYYFTSSSTDNYIIDPASTTDKIRVTSTSGVKIENTDSNVFSHDSLNTSYAYLTNFSMLVSGASQTFDITQHDMMILPSNDNLSIMNFEWGNTVQFDAESSIGVNQTWFNITNERWDNEQISIFVDDLPYNLSYADDNGTLDYNYSVGIGNNFFEFILSIPPSPVPVSIFIFMGVLLFVFCGASFILTGITSIFTSTLSIMFAFIMSKIAINGSLVQNVGGVSSSGVVVQGVTRIEIPALSYILIFVGLVMVVILAVQVLREIKFRESQNTIELDL